MESRTATCDVRNVSKAYPGTVALDNVSLALTGGEIHGLCGGNGSGKSTLIKILAGVENADPGGELRVGRVEHPAHQWSATTALHAGVRVVHQDLGIFPELTVAENMCIGAGFITDGVGRIKWRQVRHETQRLLERFEIDVAPEAVVGDLSRAVQTQIAIARALQDEEHARSGLLILDEPTAALPAHEVEVLLAALRRYAAAGMAILFVSHRLDEVLAVTDKVTILRDGVKLGTYDTATLDEERLVELIVGRGVETLLSQLADAPGAYDKDPGHALLELQDVWAGPLRGVQLRVQPGEVVGIAGLLGSGRSELLRCVFGDLAMTRGTIAVDGRQVDFRHPSQAIAAGVAFVPEDRADATFPDEPIYRDLASSVTGSYWRRGWLSDRAMRRDAPELLGRFAVKASSPSDTMSSLSGGNQQKVVMARWLRRSPKLLLLDEPTNGVDVGARAEIHRMVRAAVDKGAAAVMVTSDFEEMAMVVDRAIVLKDGRLTRVLHRDELSAERLTHLSHANG
jgi:ribose transport system ATP-binding protein